jgi:hypothetical protein
MTQQDIEPRNTFTDLYPIFGTRLGYGIVGGCAGLGATVWGMMQLPRTDFGSAKGLLFLSAGVLCGILVGLDLFSTRRWRRFGRFTIVARLAAACSSAASLTGLVGVFLGMIHASDLWMIGAGGAIIGAALGLRIVFNI